jgi:hypothetical protein
MASSRAEIGGKIVGRLASVGWFLPTEEMLMKSSQKYLKFQHQPMRVN